MIIYGGEKSLQLQLIEEIETINGKIVLQEKNRNMCNVYMEKISDYINHVVPSSIANQFQLENTLKSLKNICDSVIIDLYELNDLKKNLYDLDNVSNDNLKECIDKYNNEHIRIMQKIDEHDVKFMDFTTFVLQNYAFVFSIANAPLTETSDITKKISHTDISNTNILIISEKDQVAYLPYKLKDVETHFKTKNKSKYSSVQEIIDNNYVVSLSLFKFPTIARFREVFNLVRRENGLLKAFETAVELMVNFNLDPIVVRACKNVQELNIFIDCLEENETDKFPCFEIRYEVTPTFRKRKKNEEFMSV